jgi:hypothetical protein
MGDYLKAEKSRRNRNTMILTSAISTAVGQAADAESAAKIIVDVIANKDDFCSKFGHKISLFEKLKSTKRKVQDSLPLVYCTWILRYNAPS